MGIFSIIPTYTSLNCPPRYKFVTLLDEGFFGYMERKSSIWSETWLMAPVTTFWWQYEVICPKQIVISLIYTYVICLHHLIIWHDKRIVIVSIKNAFEIIEKLNSYNYSTIHKSISKCKVLCNSCPGFESMALCSWGKRSTLSYRRVLQICTKPHHFLVFYSLCHGKEMFTDHIASHRLESNQTWKNPYASLYICLKKGSYFLHYYILWFAITRTLNLWSQLLPTKVSQKYKI